VSKEMDVNTSTTDSCLICAMETTESESVIFRDELWAAEIGPGMDVPGWCVLRTRRHAELITGLDDPEADALGRRLRALVAAVAEVTGAPATYQLSFGEDYRHFHTLVTARGEHISTDRRRGDILKLRDEGHRDLVAAQAMVPRIRAAYTRFTEQERVADNVG
jgi:diadenosine tetraphosphate (Ap4A) HIT family hydrolase